MPGCSSLKEKRIRGPVPASDRLRANRFNVSVAETGLQDVHERAELTVAFVASDGRMAESVLDKTDRFVEEHGGAVITRVRRERYG